MTTKNSDVPRWPLGDEKRRVLEFFTPNYGTKLFVENGVLIEEKIESQSDGDIAGTDDSVGFFPALVEEHVVDKSHTINSAYEYYTTRDGDSGGPVGFLPGVCYDGPKWPVQKHVRDDSQTINSAKRSLEYYNIKHDTHYVLVNPINSNAFIRSGKIWIHSSFIAKDDTSTSDTSDTSTETCQDGSVKAKLFFAEVMIAGREGDSAKYVTTACRILDGSRTIDHCEICPKGSFSHPKSKFRQGSYKVISRALRPRNNGKVLKKRAPNSRGN